MLIVAIPKSGSTAIMETLGKGHGITYTQYTLEEIAPDRIIVDPRVVPISVFHGDLFDYGADFLKSTSRSKTVLSKQHVAPSLANRSALAGERIVVLLRDPLHIVDAYHRGFAKQMHRVPEGLPRDITLDAWREHARQSGILDALNWFYQAWRSDPDPNWLFIDFNQLIGSPTGSIRIIEEHLGLPASGLTDLRKARYSKSLIIPYRHNRIWRDHIQNLRTLPKRSILGLKRSSSGIRRSAMALVQGVASFMPGFLKRSSIVRNMYDKFLSKLW